MKLSFLVFSLDVKKFSVQILSIDFAVHRYKSMGVMWISYFLTSALNSFRVEEWKSCLHCLMLGSVCTFLSVIVVQSYNSPILGGVCVHIVPCMKVGLKRINKKVKMG